MELVPSTGTRVFISYSHADKPWLERLKRHLKPLVREGQLDCWDDTHIRPGDDWKQEIRTALDTAHVAVLLISADFFASDFIDENELPPLLLAAQAKGVRILPVIVSASRFARHPDLVRFQAVNSPDRPLAKMQPADQEEVFERLAQSVESTFARIAGAYQDPTFRPLLVTAGAPDRDAEDSSWDDVECANASIQLLRSLIRKLPAAADAVSRSREAIENASYKIKKLELFKTVHDALHFVELNCLRPLQAEDLARNGRRRKIEFARQKRKIEDRVMQDKLPSFLQDDLLEMLDSAAAAFDAALEKPSEEGREQIVSELERLLALASPQLDFAISAAASELHFDHIISLMVTVRDALHAAADLTLNGVTRDFAQGIGALQAMDDELTRRVREHGQLQLLDAKLREICAARPVPGTLCRQWERVRKARSRLQPPFSVELGQADADLRVIEADVEATLVQGDEKTALEWIIVYFGAVSSVFRDVDVRLREFSLQLTVLSPSLQAVLSEPRIEERAWAKR